VIVLVKEVYFKAVVNSYEDLVPYKSNACACISFIEPEI